MKQKPQRRRRGVVLTPSGLERLKAAIQKAEYWDHEGQRYTLEDLSERIGLDPKTIAKVLDGQVSLDKGSLERCFRSFELAFTPEDYQQPTRQPSPTSASIKANCRTDWGEAVDTSIFFGRTSELQTLTQWILDEHCRVIALLGLGGVGKTSLSVKLAKQISTHPQAPFDWVIWRSLRNAPPLSVLLADLLQVLTSGATTEPITYPGRQLAQLIAMLQQNRCLLVLDNWETVLRSGAGYRRDLAGQSRPEYEGYGDLLRQLAEIDHRSCVVITSREKPAEVADLAGESLPVRSFLMQGLDAAAATQLCQVKGLILAERDSVRLTQLYDGNPLGLKMVATAIQDVFAGDVSTFLTEGVAVFNGLRILLEQQWQRLSQLEQQLMIWLAISREPIPLSRLRADLVSPPSAPNLLEALESLRRRSLCVTVPTLPTRFTLQPVVMEYVTSTFVEAVIEDIVTGDTTSSLLQRPLNNYPLLTVQAKESIQLSQRRFMVQPVVDALLAQFHHPGQIEQVLKQGLHRMQQEMPLAPGYAAGNLLNLLCHLEADLRGLDLARLTLRQANLQHQPLPQVNFIGSDLRTTEFAKAFMAVTSADWHPHGELLATGLFDGEILLWNLRGQPVQRFEVERGNIWSVAFSPDGTRLASGGDDHLVRLWDLESGQCVQTFPDQTGAIYSIAFLNQGQQLISTGEAGTIRIWDLPTGHCKRHWQAHDALIWSIALNPDQTLLATASDDYTVKLWDIDSGECVKTLVGHTDWVRCLAFDPAGDRLASGGCDTTIRLWEVETGDCLNVIENHTGSFALLFIDQGRQLVNGGADRMVGVTEVATGKRVRTLSGHTSQIYTLAMNPQGSILVSAGEDAQIRFWQMSDRTCLKSIQAHIDGIAAIACQPQGNLIATGSTDGAVRFWLYPTSSYCTSWEHHDRIFALAFSPDGRTVASGSVDQTIRLWEAQTGHCQRILQGHSSQVTGVDFHPQGQYLASGSSDCTVKVWDLKTGQVIQTLSEHFIQSVAFSSNGQYLAVGTFNPAVTLWDWTTGECCQTFVGHTNWAWFVAFSPDGQRLASCGGDQTIRLWDVSTGNCLQVLEGHTDWIMRPAFSPEGDLLATASKDGTLRLWDIKTGTCVAVLTDHHAWVGSVAFSSDGKQLISGSKELTLKIWDRFTFECLETWKGDRLYEGMNISKTQGLTVPLKQMLVNLGAIS